MEKWMSYDSEQLRLLMDKLVVIAHQQCEAEQVTDALVDDAKAAQSLASSVAAVCSWATSRLPRA